MTAGTAPGSAPARNGWIDVWRFLASIAIALFHFGGKGSLRFPSGGLFVEFYFILTGFWACSWLERQSPDAGFSLFHRRYRGPAGLVLNYMVNWYAKVVPYAAFGVALLYAVGVCQKNFTALQILKFIGQTPFEFLLLQNAGIVRSWAYVLWYLSAVVLFASPLLYLAAANPDLFFSYGVLVGPWLCHGYLLQTAGTLRVNGFGIATPLRVWGGILAGGLTYLLANHIRQSVIARHGGGGKFYPPSKFSCFWPPFSPRRSERGRNRSPTKRSFSSSLRRSV